MYPQIPGTTPELHRTAVRIATMGRIIVQAFLPPEVRVDAQRRMYLTALGELLQLSERRRDAP